MGKSVHTLCTPPLDIRLALVPVHPRLPSISTMTKRRRRFNIRAHQLFSSAGGPSMAAPLQTLARHSLIATLGPDRDPQNACILFATIPSEIRNNIFSLALYSYYDTARPYPEYSFYSRPGYRFHRRIDTALLATCRRIYSETHDLPISQNEHVFWCGRGPSSVSIEGALRRYFERLTEEQLSAVVQAHFFTQLFWLEGTFPTICTLPVMKAKHIKITVRYTDWWYWENNVPLAMKSQWIDNLKFIAGLQSLEVELETIERDKTQMETIAQNMLRWRIPLTGRVLTTEGNPIVSERIQGPSRYKDGAIEYSTALGGWVPIGNINEPPEPRYLQYVVLILLWTAKASK
ncbi:hypothetical protein HYPSUDRAFT_1019455 [Hypholoma sublateritium FD-334 SS-4]|uniref:Uncharacterized protein n=1 Tax=Hypholoma sublateritium (strain FD-334 SS-4) TaxID=945553 RepID=A0A0D2KS33_HYPSF|nr:hypothetical protein HYPSUDRAFT_1019455 [Hypholoma sublateritium FD-334 SS-4]